MLKNRKGWFLEKFQQNVNFNLESRLAEHVLITVHSRTFAALAFGRLALCDCRDARCGRF
jgi:hypothetical protein